MTNFNKPDNTNSDNSYGGLFFWKQSNIPQLNTPVLIFTQDGYQAIACLELHGGSIRWAWEHQAWFLSEVTHWLELPRSPIRTSQPTNINPKS
jgi:hypothetical protein